MNNFGTQSIRKTAGETDISLSHIADFYNRYPGEDVQFSTRINSFPEGEDIRLTISIPHGLELVSYSANPSDLFLQGYIRETQEGIEIVLPVVNGRRTGEQQATIHTEAAILPAGRDIQVTSIAEIRDGEGSLVSSEHVQVRIKSQSEYMKYLPEIYADNEFLGRLLMTFESFWRPLNFQIDQGEFYYDPDLTPDGFLPWLASWIGVTWDKHLSEPRCRELLHSALSIYQHRGTRKAIYDFLRIYTGGEVQIIEHRTQNFVMGNKSYLGHTIALGKKNYPHTFTVNLKIPQQEISGFSGLDELHQKIYYQQIVEKLIESQKPAHTAFRLNLEVTQADTGIRN
jgi:phage tail-like protein